MTRAEGDTTPIIKHGITIEIFNTMNSTLLDGHVITVFNFNTVVSYWCGISMVFTSAREANGLLPPHRNVTTLQP